MCMFDISKALEQCKDYPIWTYPIHQPHAEICPVCGGKGKVDDSDTKESTKPCHGCGGSGGE